MNLYNTWITIVKADYNERQSVTKYIYVCILTFIANITLLNLIVAILSDAYAEAISSID